MTWIAVESQEVEVASYDNEDCAFDGTCIYYAVVGCGLPPKSCLDIPETKEGFVAVRNQGEDGWEYVEDNRGKKVYSTTDLSESEIDYVGEIKEGYTYLKPKTQFDKWNGVKWVTDKVEQSNYNTEQNELKKQFLIQECNNHINTNQWPSKLALGRLSDTGKATFNMWLDYLDALTVVDPIKPVWPLKPE